jgi:hypothetical protein
MSERRFSHVFNVSAADYWDKLFFDPEYNAALFTGRLKFESWVVVKSEETDGEIRRIVEAVPTVGDVPGPIKKLLKSGTKYTEHGVFDKAKREYSVNAHSASLGDRLAVTGVTSTEAISDSQCRRVHVARVEAKIFGVGGMLEKRVLDDMARSYDKAAEFSNQWIADHLG